MIFIFSQKHTYNQLYLEYYIKDLYNIWIINYGMPFGNTGLWPSTKIHSCQVYNASKVKADNPVCQQDKFEGWQKE
jgi:hypothetical protein